MNEHNVDNNDPKQPASAVRKPDIQDAALAMKEMFEEGLAYDAVEDTWLRWCGTHWQDTAKAKTELDRMAMEALRYVGVNISGAAKIDGTIRLAKVQMKRDFSEKAGLINFINGTLDIASGELHDHNPADGLRYCLFYEYDPTGEHPVIDQYLAESVPDPLAIECVKTHIGLSLMRDNSMHYALIVQGVPRSGKSLMLALIKTMCGAATRDEAYAFAGASIFKEDIEGKRARFQWNKGLVVCLDEVPPDAMREEEAFKNMSAHSGVEARGINRDEQENTTWKPKLVLATNNTPRFKDASGAMTERIVPIRMPRHRVEGERNQALLEKMREECGAFAATCIRSALETKKRGFYCRSRGMMNMLALWATTGNPLRSFVQENCVLDADARVTLRMLFQAYKNKCQDSDQRNLQMDNMAAELLDMGIGTTKKSVRDPQTKQPVKGLAGIRLKTEEEMRASLDEDSDLDVNDYRPATETDEELLIRAQALVDEKQYVEARKVILQVRNVEDRTFAIDQLDGVGCVKAQAPIMTEPVIDCVSARQEMMDRLRERKAAQG